MTRNPGHFFIYKILQILFYLLKAGCYPTFVTHFIWVLAREDAHF